jgi:hypothetical protein
MALFFRTVANARGDQKVTHGEWEVGLIDKRSFAGTARYIWHLNGVPAGPEGIRLTGMAGTVDEAEAELKKCWQQWLAWASLSDAGPQAPLSFYALQVRPSAHRVPQVPADSDHVPQPQVPPGSEAPPGFRTPQVPSPDRILTSSDPAHQAPLNSLPSNDRAPQPQVPLGPDHAPQPQLLPSSEPMADLNCLSILISLEP